MVSGVWGGMFFPACGQTAAVYGSRCGAAKVRRLYDIANVFVESGIIEKVKLDNLRKPAFRWRGPEIDKLDATLTHGAAALARCPRLPSAARTA